MSTVKVEISFWRAYLAGQYSPKVAPVRSSTTPVKRVELAPRGQSKKAAGVDPVSGSSPGDALAGAAHVLPASKQPSCSPNLSFQSLMLLKLAVFSLACTAVGMRLHHFHCAGSSLC